MATYRRKTAQRSSSVGGRDSLPCSVEVGHHALGPIFDAIARCGSAFPQSLRSGCFKSLFKLLIELNVEAFDPQPERGTLMAA